MGHIITADVAVDQPDDHTVFTAEEADVLRDQIGPAPKRPGRPSIGPKSTIRLPEETWAALDARASTLEVDRSTLIRQYIDAGLKRSLYTVQIEFSYNDGQIWQATEFPERVEAEPEETAEDIARWAASNQNQSDSGEWRVVVWEGDERILVCEHGEMRDDPAYILYGSGR